MEVTGQGRESLPCPSTEIINNNTMLTLEIAIHRAIAQGIKRVSGFSGGIPGEPCGFELGDTFTVPTQFEVYEERIGEYTNQFIFVETVNGDIRKLYPSQLSRIVSVYDIDGTPIGSKMIANGTASQLYRQFGTVADGMNALKGKTIRVTDIVKVQSCFGPKTVYTFDLV